MRPISTTRPTSSHRVPFSTFSPWRLGGGAGLLAEIFVLQKKCFFFLETAYKKEIRVCIFRAKLRTYLVVTRINRWRARFFRMHIRGPVSAHIFRQFTRFFRRDLGKITSGVRLALQDVESKCPTVLSNPNPKPVPTTVSYASL